MNEMKKKFIGQNNQMKYSKEINSNDHILYTRIHNYKLILLT